MGEIREWLASMLPDRLPVNLRQLPQRLARQGDGETLYRLLYDKTLKIWDLATGEELKTLSGHTDSVNAVAISPNSKLAVSASSDKTLKLWDLSSGKEIATFVGVSALYCCDIAPDGVTIVAGENSGKVHFLRLDSLTQQ